jgi:hypothetical protein
MTLLERIPKREPQTIESIFLRVIQGQILAGLRHTFTSRYGIIAGAPGLTVQV